MKMSKNWENYVLALLTFGVWMFLWNWKIRDIFPESFPEYQAIINLVWFGATIFITLSWIINGKGITNEKQKTNTN
jgi:hypothetical protein